MDKKIQFKDYTLEDAEYDWRVEREEKLHRVDGYLLEFARWYEHCMVKNNQFLLRTNLRKTSEEILKALTLQCSACGSGY